jgi:hypothetical protein
MHDDIDNPERYTLPADEATTLRSVWQDKRAARGALRASATPTEQSAHPKTMSAKRHKVKITTWVYDDVKQEFERRATAEGLSLSEISAVALENWVAGQLHVQHAGILQPIIEQAITKQMRAYSSRLAMLLVRSMFASEQTRALATNILSRQQGVTQPVLESILDGTSDTARRNITRVTPQLAALIQEVEQWLEQSA